MKRLFIIAVILTIFTGFSSQAHADLELRGTDSLGNRLIYDSDLNITWYDYTNNRANEFDQRTWADTLTVNFNGIIYDNWRRPTTAQPDPTCSIQDSYGSYGFNCANSEMGHLYYVDLGNVAGGPLTNTGDFQNLVDGTYYSGTVAPIFQIKWWWSFDFSNGHQYYSEYAADLYAIAVRDGDIAVVPEPISSILFITGVTLLTGRRYLRIKRKELTVNG